MSWQDGLDSEELGRMGWIQGSQLGYGMGQEELAGWVGFRGVDKGGLDSEKFLGWVGLGGFCRMG